ncbi:DMT family transporter [Microbacterium betulae]|uniref:DMT family transporter n=2 Tax=Microbacterium betulae TaxID=2981139 RepID=A0AA97FM08_9MICO|nr:DMT family transporter [Microbacterium sp. AB]
MASGVPRRGLLRPVVGVGGAVAVGALTAVQARVNGQLGLALDAGLVAAVVSFGSGFLILVVLSAALPAGRRGLSSLATALRERRLPWWLLAGGGAGAFSVATQSLTVAVIGVAMFSVGMIAGQTVHGLVLDRVGYSPAGVSAVTLPRLAGALLVLAAVAVSLTGGSIARTPLWMLVLPFLVGAGVAWQTATNGRLRQRIGSALSATLVNFAGGTLVLGVAALCHVAFVGAPAPAPPQPWLYLGGALGVAYIFISAALTPRTGVLLMTLGSVLGMLAASVVLDVVWPPESPPAVWQRALTVALAAAGVIVASLPPRLRRG